MALDQKFFKKSTAGSTDQEQGLVLHLDANDVDSYDGDGSIWYDINGHDINTPLADKSDNLVLNLDGGTYTSGAWEDQSANTNNASLNGNATYNSDTRGYFTLDGTGDYLQIADHSSLNLGAATYEMWFRQPSYIATEHLFGRYESSNFDFYIRTSGTSGAIDLTFYDGSSSIASITSSNSAYTANEWSHVAVTLAGNTSGSAVKLYVNGALQGSTTLSANRITDAAANLYLGILGSGYTGTYEFTGDIGTTRIYNVALTAAEVGQNYRAGNFINYSSIITSKHEATQDTLYTTNLNLSLDANNYSGSGDWQDGTNDNDGVISGATYTNDGNSDYFDFDGSNDYINVAGSDLNPANTKCIELWFNTDSTSEQYIISNNNGSGAYGYHMGVTSGKLFMWIYSQEQGHYHVNTSTGSSNTAAITVGEWNHAVWTMGPNASDNKIYLNGNLAYTESSIGGGTYPSTAAYNGINIGKYTSSGWFNGKLAQVRAYSTALTQAQITTNYNATKELYQNPNVLTDLRPSDYSSGTTWSDSSTKSNNATLNNFSSTVTDYYDQELGNFFDLDGSNDYFSTSITKDWASIPFSVEMWFNTDSRNGEYLWGLNESSSMAYGVGASVRGSGNSYHLQFLGSGFIVSAGVVETNRWYHLVFTSDGTTKKAYLDGELKGTGTTTINSAANGKAFIFGRYGTYNGAYFNGKIGHTRVYEGVLTAEQVAQNYLATKNKYPNGINFTGSNISWNANGYFSFNGSNANFATSGAPSALINATGFTVSAWVWRTNGVTGTNTIFTNCHDNGNSGQNWILSMTGSGTTHFHIYGTDNYAGVTDLVSYETWTHLAGVVEFDGVKRIYKNGVVQLSTSAGYSADTVSSYNGFIGSLGSYGNYHNGRIGAVKYYKKPLTADELLADFNATKGTYGL